MYMKFLLRMIQHRTRDENNKPVYGLKEYIASNIVRLIASIQVVNVYLNLFSVIQ